MPTRAKLYISSTIAVGLSLLAGCLFFQWEFPDLPQYFGYLILSCVASTLKITLPTLRGNISINFLFILIGIAELTISETIALGCVAALIQSLWKPRKRPALVQVLFNISTLATSIAISYTISHALAPGQNLPVLLAVAVCAYFVLNTGMVSLVLALTEAQPFAKVWRQCYLWSFPYYLVGAIVAGTIAASGRSAGWKPALLVLPLMYMVYSYYRLYLSIQPGQDYKPA